MGGGVGGGVGLGGGGVGQRGKNQPIKDPISLTLGRAPLKVGF